MPSGIVVGRAADQGHQQCDLGAAELLQGLGKVEMTRETEAMDRAAPVLSQIDFVQISFQDLVLIVVQLQ